MKLFYGQPSKKGLVFHAEILLGLADMELNVPFTDDALRLGLADVTSNRDAELIACTGLAVVFHGHNECAGRSIAVTGAGELHCFRRPVRIRRDHLDIVD